MRRARRALHDGARARDLGVAPFRLEPARDVGTGHWLAN